MPSKTSKARKIVAKGAKNPVVKKWVAALRSGKIKQAHGYLGTPDGNRCCLGVLCDLAVESGIIPSFKLSSVYMPEKVAEWAGLQTTKAEYGNDQALWKDNDGHVTGVGSIGRKKNFKTIARIIESEPEGLFTT